MKREAVPLLENGGCGIKLTIPIRTVSESNQRCHWAVKARRVKKQREAVALCWATLERYERVALPATAKSQGLVVTLTRIGVRALDSDNLARAFKACRDELAKQLGIDDGDPRIEWRYAQRKGKPKEHSVEVEFAVMPNERNWTKPLQNQKCSSDTSTALK